MLEINFGLYKMMEGDNSIKKIIVSMERFIEFHAHLSFEDLIIVG